MTKTKYNLKKIITALSFIFLILIISFSCKQKSSLKLNKKIICNAEILSKDKKFFISVKDNEFFSGAYTRSKEAAHSGKFSAKINKKHPYTFSYKINNVQAGDYYKITVWRKSKNNKGILVIADKTAEKFYVPIRKPVKTEKNGWEMLQADVEIPHCIRNEYIKIYMWNPDKEPAYFDDLTIEKLPEKVYPRFKEKSLRIFIDTLDMLKLYKKRDIAFKNGVLETADDDWVKAMIFYGEDMMKAKVRLKGDWLDHLHGKKWSFRIKIRKNKSWKNLKTFSIQNPVTRDFLKGYLAHKIYEKEDLLTPRYDFVPVILNNKSLGLYAYEEHFEKQLVEAKNRREGPILKLSDYGLWAIQKLSKTKNKFYKLPYFDASDILPFKQNKTIESPVLKQEFLIAQNLYFEYKNRLKSASEIFDVNLMAKYFALIDLTKGYHGFIFHNQRFYYNPVTCKLEPILFDCYTEGGPFDFVHRAIAANSDFDQNKTIRATMRYNLFTDTSFVKLYIHYLEKYSDENYIKNILSEFKPEINKYENLIRQEFQYYHFDSLFLLKNAKAIREDLPAYKKKFRDNPHYAENYKKFQTNEKTYDTIYYEGFPEYYVNAFIEKKENTKNHSIIKIYNYYPNDIIILGTGKNKRKINYFFHPEPNICSYNNPENKPIEVDSDTTAKYLFFMVKGHFKTFTTDIFQWNSPYASTPLQELMAKSTFPENKAYTILKNNTILFKKGKHIVNEFIIIPKNYKVKFEQGAEIDFINKGGFLSYSPVYILGTKQNPVKIYSSDSSAMGFNVLQAGKKSIVKNAIFDNLSRLNYKGWALTAAVCFYESNVEIYNTTLKNNKACDDQLNIVRSDFIIDNCEFYNTFADAFDSDFSTGIVKNTKFTKIGNDAVDFSGSKINIENCNINNINDKGISGGENSTLSVSNTNINNCNIGVASKDLSLVEIKSSKIKNCKYAFTAFQKKPEYGPATIIAKKITYNNNDTLYLIETNSLLNLNQKQIPGDKKDVADIFYNK